MNDERPRHMLVTMTEKAAEAVSFDRLLVIGLLAALILILVLSAFLAFRGDKAHAELVLGFYKDLALILAGALANSVRHGKKDSSS